MIHNYFKDGQKLDVAGLNEITVLIDRSETELTEVGWNSWRPKLNGPPHKHNDKDQIFYITDGEGKVKLGDDIFEAKPGYLFYVPAGLVHQTITTGVVPLSYMLFNIFNDTGKEGHATFADHIEKVKTIRKQQAESGTSNVVEENFFGEIKPPKFIGDIYSGKRNESGSDSTISLLSRHETNRCELSVVTRDEGNKVTMVASGDVERTLFVLKGEGLITIGWETEKINPGDVVFVPGNAPHSVEALDSRLTYLLLETFI